MPEIGEYMIKSMLKWAGGKTRVMPELLPHLNGGELLIEPFAGGDSVFMNTDYKSYIIADINSDLISMYVNASCETELFISCLRDLFNGGSGVDYYNKLRLAFNIIGDKTSLVSSALFLYLNRHCYNGLCRYNQSGGFNVPDGKYKNPYFPEKEIRLFAEKVRDTHTRFINAGFETTIFLFARSGATIYCDPPYLPETGKGSFTQYHTAPFGSAQHALLVETLQRASNNHRLKVVISGSDTPETRQAYKNFDLQSLNVMRSVGASVSTRRSSEELIGVLRVCGGCGYAGGGLCPDCGSLMSDATYSQMNAQGAFGE